MTSEQGEWLARVLPYYTEPQRFYHNEKHLCLVLTLLQHASRSHGYSDIPMPLFFAALYHDAVYDPQRSDNEERSADVCRKEMTAAHLPIETRERAIHLILSTRFHTPTDRRFDAITLLDADLWILGSSPTDYQRYADQIRAEYFHVPENAYRAGRAAVLQKFLERPVLYYGRGAKVLRREQQARENLRTEIRSLSTP